MTRDTAYESTFPSHTSPKPHKTLLLPDAFSPERPLRLWGLSSWLLLLSQELPWWPVVAFSGLRSLRLASTGGTLVRLLVGHS